MRWLIIPRGMAAVAGSVLLSSYKLAPGAVGAVPPPHDRLIAMRGWAWAGVVALVAAWGDGMSGAPADAAGHDASSPADASGGDASADASTLDAAPPACDLDPGLPEPPVCAQSVPWAAYIGDELLDGRAAAFILTMDGSPGEPELASGDLDVRNGLPTLWSFAPDGSALAFMTSAGLHATPITGAGPGEIREVSGPFTANGFITWWEWSPDGTKLAYVADQERARVRELWMLDLAPLTDGISDYITDRWVWAPDGRSVVFRNGGSLYTARVACGAITDGPRLVTSLISMSEVMSPEGNELFYLGRIDAATAALYRADLTVTPPAVSQISEPGAITFDSTLAWSPTAPRLAFRTTRRLEVLDGTTGERSIVSGPLVADGRVFRFAWSPDGQSIAYTANQLDVSRVELFHVDMSGPAPRRRRRVSLPVVYQLFVLELVWSGDSSHLAYTANQDAEARRELYAAARADGVMGEPVRLNPPLERDEAGVRDVSWSPDGTRLLYISNEAGAGVDDAFAVALAAPGEAAPINGAPDAFYVAWAPCPSR